MRKLFTVNGQQMRLYTIGELASAITRDPITVRKWERYGVIPRARFRDKQGRRLYTKEEIDVLVRIVAEEGPQTGVALKTTRLTARAFAEWATLRELPTTASRTTPRDDRPSDT